MMLILPANAAVARGQEWKVGFWDWRQAEEHSTPLNGAQVPLDVLYLLAGNITVSPQVDPTSAITGRVPSAPAPATMVFFVWRFTNDSPPPVELAQSLAMRYASLKAKAVQQGLPVVGIQLDYDCPTAQLPVFSQFTRTLRQHLPKEERLSVTALLDWFRPGTEVAALVAGVDEFVPQFYDVKETAEGQEGRRELPAEIAKTIDPAHWAPVFNAFQRPYRLGIANFGRMIGRPKPGAMHRGQPVAAQFLTADLLDIRAEARLSAPTVNLSPAGEEIVRFQVELLKNSQGYFVPEWLSHIELIIPTKQSIQRAYQAAQAMGGWCQGVVFFRWPLRNESMVLHPNEVLRAIQGMEMLQAEAQVEVEDGFCATVQCANLYLRPKNRFNREPVSFIVQATVPLEYFLPEQGTPVVVRGANELLVTLPPFCGMARIALGRAVTKDTAIYTVREASR